VKESLLTTGITLYSKLMIIAFVYSIYKLRGLTQSGVIERIHFMLYIRFHRFNGIYVAISFSFKILNEVMSCIPLNATKQKQNFDRKMNHLHFTLNVK